MSVPIRHAGQAAEPERHLRLEGREGALMSPDQVAAPNRCIPAPRAQRRKGAVRAVARLALGERLVAEQIEAVVQARVPGRQHAGAGGPSPPSSHQPPTPKPTSGRCASHHQAATVRSRKSRWRWPSSIVGRRDALPAHPVVAAARRKPRGLGLGVDSGDSSWSTGYSWVMTRNAAR